jgi:tRNA pseudouridine55 synthase
MYLSYKPLGETPLEHLNKLKKDGKLKEKCCYAGRLDPMAHGLMIYLMNDECKNVSNYLGLDKTYKFKIAFGINTDTYDILGKITSVSNQYPKCSDIMNNLHKFTGNIKQKYPPYSSYHVDKKPLWEHSKNNNIKNINIPEKTVKINSIKLSGSNIINFEDFRENVIHKINLMNSKTFRNDEIINDWKSVELDNIFIVELEANVESGTYIRSICYQMGKLFGSGAIAYDILRIKIGNYNL